jgi:SAM-dependent methyltransferase
VLDVACGSGRHLQWFADRGHPVCGIDQDIAAATLALGSRAELVQADIENGPWPLQERRFGAVVVTNYLWRALVPTLLQSLVPGGLLIYETFAIGNAHYGRPARPEFLLQSGELLQICADMQVVAYENGLLADPQRVVQRIVAFTPGLPDGSPQAAWRHPL